MILQHTAFKPRVSLPCECKKHGKNCKQTSVSIYVWLVGVAYFHCSETVFDLVVFVLVYGIVVVDAQRS